MLLLASVSEASYNLLMTARTHDAFAFASLVTVAAFYPPQTLNVSTFFTAIVGNIIGALLPDLDQASNRLWDLLPAGNFLGKIFRNILLGHRTISHSLLGIYILYKILPFILTKLFNPDFINIQIVFASIMIGFVSHIFSDSLTKEGVPLFFPLKLKIGIPPISALRITTGKWVENIVVLPGVAIYLFWFVFTYQDKVLKLLRVIQK